MGGLRSSIVTKAVILRVTSLKSCVLLLRSRKIRTTPYNPKGNAQCEKFNRTLLSMLETLEPGDKAKWQQWVPTLTHAYNCTCCESTGFSPYYLMFGRMPHLSVDIEYGVTQPELIDKSRQNYARKLTSTSELGVPSCQRHKRERV